jgi:class 3 adenylate cyclase
MAADKFYRMLDLRIAIDDTVGTATAYNNIGNIFYYQGDYSKALENYIRSLEYEEMTAGRNGESGLATSYLNIGSVYALQEEFYQALNYFTKALLLYQQADDVNGTASAYTNIATTYKSLDSLDKANQYFLKAVPLLTQTRDDHSLGIAYLNMADVYRRQGDTGKMFEYFYKSEQLRKNLRDEMGLATLWISRGMSNAGLGRYKQAREECERALKIVEGKQAAKEIRDACDCLYQAHKGLKQGDLALAYFERASKLQDSLARDDTRMDLQVMEFRKQVARDSVKREEEKAAIATAHSRELIKGNRLRNVLLIAGLALGFVSVSFYRLFNKTHRAKMVVEKEKRKADELLLNILPAEIAEELKQHGKVAAQEFDNVTILFTDFVGFTEASEKIRPQELVKELNHIYTRFDEIASKYGIEKIKNIGDAYMAAGGLPIANELSVRNTVLAALHMQEFVLNRNKERKAAGLPAFEMRAGIHTGPVVAGIIGVKKFQYDVWGDTVNTAHRMESNDEPGRVNISASTYQFIKKDPEFTFQPRERIEVKGKGEMQMYLVALRTTSLKFTA